ncbi:MULTISPECIES: hypothetical protein [unclassified Pseudomonas]|uniref:hypothetical protein n=1 Tax=unclassified Pseudomonas TaxID=196821 RepID=UPI00244CA497|nr:MULTISPECIES: hypothetical protein [unclassified Pseudomonas]MDH0302923.1 hypothetical protein [Pseudomonas sp. GD04091]MDH1985472.1 hypothetical protein [Pseudomonas sp. GD03689]
MTTHISFDAADAVLDPALAQNGATTSVTYPDIRASDEIKVTWGQLYETPPQFGDAAPLLFEIPTWVVAASQGEEIPVTYAVTRDGMPVTTSDVLNLQVLELDAGHLPTPWVPAANEYGELDPIGMEEDTNVLLAPWPLIARGQRYWMSVNGTLHNGDRQTFPLASGQVVDDDEVVNGLDVILPLQVLRQLQEGSRLTISTRVAFVPAQDEQQAREFPERELTILTSTDCEEDFSAVPRQVLSNDNPVLTPSRMQITPVQVGSAWGVTTNINTTLDNTLFIAGETILRFTFPRAIRTFSVSAFYVHTLGQTFRFHDHLGFVDALTLPISRERPPRTSTFTAPPGRSIEWAELISVPEPPNDSGFGIDRVAWDLCAGAQAHPLSRLVRQQNPDVPTPLSLEAETMLDENLPAPEVAKAQGPVLSPHDALDGASVRVRYDAMQRTDLIELTWGETTIGQQHGNASGFVDFHVPVSVVAASMGKQLWVQYSVTQERESTRISQPLFLEVQALAQADLPTPTVTQAQWGELILADFEGDATIELDHWLLSAPGQLFWIVVNGTQADGSAFRFYAARNQPVEDEPQDIEVVLPRAELAKLQFGAPLRIQAKVAFDGNPDESLARVLTEQALVVRQQPLTSGRETFATLPAAALVVGRPVEIRSGMLIEPLFLGNQMSNINVSHENTLFAADSSILQFSSSGVFETFSLYTHGVKTSSESASHQLLLAFYDSQGLIDTLAIPFTTDRQPVKNTFTAPLGRSIERVLMTNMAPGNLGGFAIVMVEWGPRLSPHHGVLFSSPTQWWDSIIHDTAANDLMDTLVLTERSNHLVTGFTSTVQGTNTTHMASVMSNRGVLSQPVVVPRIYTGIQRGIHYAAIPGTDNIVPVWASNHDTNIFNIYLSRYEVDEFGMRDNYGTRNVSGSGGYNIHPRIVYCPQAGTQGLLLVTWVNVTGTVGSIKGTYYDVATLTPRSPEFEITRVIDAGYRANTTDLNTSLTHAITLTYYSNTVYAVYKENASTLRIVQVGLPIQGRVEIYPFSSLGATSINRFDITLRDDPFTPELMIVYTRQQPNQGILLYGDTIALFPWSAALPAPVTLTQMAGVSQPSIVEAHRTSDGKKPSDPTKITRFEYIVAWNRTAGGVSYARYNEQFRPIGPERNINHNDNLVTNPRVATSDNQIAIYTEAGTGSGMRNRGLLLRTEDLDRS